MALTKNKPLSPKTMPVILSLALIFVAVSHTLEDFALGEPAKNGVPALVLASFVAGLIMLQGLALFWIGKNDRRGYFVHIGLGVFWPLAAGIAQLPVIFSSSHYRSGFISIFYVVGMVTAGILLVLTSIKVLKTLSSPKA